MSILTRKSGRSTPAQMISTWDPFEQMRELLREEFPQLSSRSSEEALSFSPDFEVKENAGEFVFKADLPGIKEQDIDISLSGDRITISGKREAEKREENDRFYAYERSFGSFSRMFTLPEGVDTEHARAELKDGVLSLVVPKTAEVKARRIPVGSKSVKA